VDLLRNLRSSGARLADLPVVLERGARFRRIPARGVAGLGEVCVADPETSDVTSSSRVPHDPKDLRNAAAWIVADSKNADHLLADRLEAWADDIERLAPLEAAVLDALNVDDLRDAAGIVREAEAMSPEDVIILGEFATRLDAAADALAALREAQQ
jgi:hypothetical protein